MSRQIKITWEVIFKDFKNRNPRIAKKALGFQPYSYATIIISFPDRVKMIYNYDSKKYRVLTESELNDWETNSLRRATV